MKRPIKIIFWLLWLFAVACGAAALVFAFTPAEAVKRSIDALTAAGSAEGITLQTIRALQARALAAGLLSLVLAVVLLWKRRSVVAALTSLIEGVRAFLLSELQSAATSSARSPAAAASLAVSTMAGLFIRLIYAEQPIRSEEAATYLEFASKPLWIAISYVPSPNNHILHTLLVHGSVRLLGDAEWALRMPSLVCGVLLIPAAAALAWRWYGPAAAAFTAAITAVLNPLILYSTNARGYLPGTLLSVLFWIFAVRLARRCEPAGTWVAAFAGALSWFCLPQMGYSLAAALFWLFWEAWYHQGLQRAIAVLARLAAGTFALATLFYAPALAASGLKGFEDLRLEYFTWKTALETTVPFFQSVLHHWNRGLPRWLAILFLMAALGACLFHRKVGRILAAPFTSILVACGALVWLVRSTGYERSWLFLAPMYAAAAGGGLAGILAAAFRQRAGGRTELRAAALLAAGLCLWQAAHHLRQRPILQWTETGVFPEARAVADYLKTRLQPGDCLTVSPPSYYPLRYYLRRQYPSEPYWAACAAPVRVWIVTRPEEFPPHEFARKRLFPRSSFEARRTLVWIGKASVSLAPEGTHPGAAH